MDSKLPLFHKHDSKNLDFHRNPKKQSGVRRYLLAVTVSLVFLVLFVRLFQLTVVKGAYYRHLAEGNRIRQIDVPAPRGMIEDRKGIVLASSKKTAEKLTRNYHEPEAISSLIGYLQIADKKDIAADSCQNRLKANDFVGRAGIEKLFECRLRGIKGKKLIEVDAVGRQRKVISYVAPLPGKTVATSLDSYLQKTAYDATLSRIENSGGIVEMSEKRAAVIALKPQTGEVLVLLSTPTFDPSAFSNGDSQKIAGYLTDEHKPLFNRATQAVYPPGSIIKPLLAIGALEEKKITPEFTVEDTGIITAGPLKFGNWYYLEYGKTEGTVDLVKGLRRSNDIYFYRVGEKMGDTLMKKWAAAFGLGAKTGIAIPEQAGLVPSAFWKREVLGERWFLGDTYNMAIGQGFLQTTPLQMAVATAAIANNGKVCTPQLEKDAPAKCRKLPISQKTLDTVREGMHQACLSGGTGWPFFDFRVKSTSEVEEQSGKTSEVKRIEVGCKTGTAESHLPSGLPHAWFTVFAPYEDPEIVLAVMVEESGQGSNVAAPIAKAILKAYFERNE